MFETLIVTQDVRPAWKSTVVVSLFAHAVILVLLVLLPLLFFEVIDARVVLPRVIFGAPPDLVPPSPPPSEPIRSVAARPASGVMQVRLDPMTIPPEIPVGVVPELPDDLPYIGDLGQFPTGIGFGGITGPMGPGVTGHTAVGLAPVRATPPPPPPRRNHKPVLVSTLSPGGLIFQVEPTYPELARKARAQGPVELDVLVNEEGVVQDVIFISGNILLKEAAVKAVKQWRYRPTILNGEPVPIKGKVTVIFKLG